MLSYPSFTQMFIYQVGKGVSAEVVTRIRNMFMGLQYTRYTSAIPRTWHELVVMLLDIYNKAHIGSQWTEYTAFTFDVDKNARTKYISKIAKLLQC